MKDYALFFAMALGLSGNLTAQQRKPSDDYTKDTGLKTSQELTRILKSESFTPESLVVLRKTVTASSDHRLNTIQSGLDKFIKDQPTSDDVLLSTRGGNPSAFFGEIGIFGLLCTLYAIFVIGIPIFSTVSAVCRTLFCGYLG